MYDGVKLGIAGIERHQGVGAPCFRERMPVADASEQSLSFGADGEDPGSRVR